MSILRSVTGSLLILNNGVIGTVEEPYNSMYSHKMDCIVQCNAQSKNAVCFYSNLQKADCNKVRIYPQRLIVNAR